MADGRHNWRGALVDGPHNGLRIERPQVFERPSAPAYDDNVHVGMLVQEFQGFNDSTGRLMALHRRWIQENGY